MKCLCCGAPADYWLIAYGNIAPICNFPECQQYTYRQFTLVNDVLYGGI